MYAFEQDVPIREDVYRKITARFGAAPLDGLIVHLALRNADGTLRYVDVWESEEKCARAFAERIHPAVAAVFRETGFRPAAEPERRPVDVVDVLGPAADAAR